MYKDFTKNKGIKKRSSCFTVCLQSLWEIVIKISLVPRRWQLVLRSYLHIVQAYTDAEVHSIKGSPGDIADVGVFSDNADKMVFEFLELFELGYIDWGNNSQRASKLSKHLSDDLKDNLMTRSDNYALMREWLVQNYSGAVQILNDTVMALTRRTKPAASHCPYLFLLLLQHWNDWRNWSVLTLCLASN